MEQSKTKPFPWKCGQCEARAVVPEVVNYTTEINHEGQAVSVDVSDLKTPRCSACGEIVLDDAANRRISEAFRKQVGILSPAEIQAGREALGLTRQQVAETLGIAEVTLVRWETGGQIQQRALDKLLRLYFELPIVRATLAGTTGTPSILREVRAVSLD